MHTDSCSRVILHAEFTAKAKMLAGQAALWISDLFEDLRRNGLDDAMESASRTWKEKTKGHDPVRTRACMIRVLELRLCKYMHMH